MNKKLLESTQSWLNISDIKEYIIYRSNGNICGAIHFDLEQRQEYLTLDDQQIYETLSSFLRHNNKCLQLFCVDKKINLDNYLYQIQTKINNEKNNEKNNARKNILTQYLWYVMNLISSGKILGRDFYIIVSENSMNYKEDLLKTLLSLEEVFNNIGLSCEICYEEKLFNMILQYTNPQSPCQKAYNNSQTPVFFE